MFAIIFKMLPIDGIFNGPKKSIRRYFVRFLLVENGFYKKKSFKGESKRTQAVSSASLNFARDVLKQLKTVIVRVTTFSTL